MVLLTTWPTLVDDTGNLSSGTPHTKAAIYDPIKAAIEALLHSNTNPTVSPKNIIDEVVAARGNMTDLDDRISGVIDPNGNLVSSSTLVSSTSAQSLLAAQNLLANETLLLWSQGDAAAPDFWALSGAGAVIARAGTGLADATRKVGKFCAKITYGAATAKLTQVLLDSGVMGDADILANTDIGFGCWVWSATNAVARITLDDGVAAPTSTTFHTGNSGWQWLSSVHTMRNAPTKMELQLSVEGAGTAYFSGAVVLISNLAPSRWVPAPKVYGSLHFPIPGVLTVGTSKAIWVPARPGLVKDIQLRAETAPTGGTLVVDVNTWDGAAFTTMCTTKPTLLTTEKNGGVQPDGTYARRCLSAAYGNATPGAGGMLSVDLDSLTGAPADLVVEVRVLQYLRWLENFLAYND